MKTCYKCKNEKEDSEFHHCKSRKDGLNSYCKECSRNSAYTYYKANYSKVGKISHSYRRKLGYLIEGIKVKYGCQNCGENAGCCLDFHHTGNDKDVDIARLVSQKNKKKIFDEINKCIVLCANCHRKAHRDLIDCKSIANCNENILDYFEERHGRYYAT